MCFQGSPSPNVPHSHGLFPEDDPDDFAILLLAAVSGGQTIYVTDNGVKADGSFRDSEGREREPREMLPKMGP